MHGCISAKSFLKPGISPLFTFHKRSKMLVRIGRVIYDDAPPPAKCMPWEDLFPVIDDRRDTMKVIFTDRVTTDPVDVDYICDLKLSPTQNFFNYNPDERNIWYEFLCDYRGKPWCGSSLRPFIVLTR